MRTLQFERQLSRPAAAALLSLLLALAVTLLMAAPATAADCGCATTGAYKSPDSKAVQIATDGSSPQNKYRVTATGTSSINLTIHRVSTNAVAYSSSIPAGSNWGFSPDADRFVYWYVRDGVHTVVLIDLTRTRNQQIWETSVRTSSARIRFSPKGKYLLYSAVTGASHVSLQIVDAASGVRRFGTEFTFTSVPGSPGDSFGMATWGFSPDNADGTFVLGWVSGQSSVQLGVVNLALGRYVHSQTIIAASAWWQFSPCGDVLGVVQQTSPTFQSVQTLRTSTGASLGSSGNVPLSDLALSATPTQHQALVNGTIYPLGANTAGAACSTPVVAESLTVAPASVVGGAANATGTVRLDRVPSSSTPITLSSSDTSAATVPASVSTTTQQKTFTVTSRAVTTTKDVTITATAGGVSKTAPLRVTPPAPTARTVTDITFTPPSVQGGDASTGRVTLSSAAPTGGLEVTLESLDADATVAPSVRVPGNETSATFAVATSPVASQVDAQIRASLGTSSSLTRTLTITATPSGGTNAVLRDGNCLANVLPANDDGSTGLLTLPAALNFFGTEYDQLFVNNNGNVTFDERLGTYTPFDLTSTSRVIIAPFFADVDTRGAGSGLVTWGTTQLNGRTTFCANWTGTSYDGVGYYSGHTNKRNTFQLLLVERADTGPGNFDIEFRYDKVQWETGDASGGSNGLGGSSARVGYSNGDPSAPGAAFELPGSAVDGALLDGAPTALTRNSRNAQENGRYVFPVRNGVPPTGGRIAGRVLGPDGTPLRAAPVQACRVDDPSACVNGRSNSAGAYALAGLRDGDYTVMAFPPAGSTLARRSIGPLTVDAGTNLTGQDITLTGPTGPPAGTAITPSTTNGQGIPSVYWHSSLTLSTTGCAGGTATYDIRRGGTSIESGPLVERAPGDYSNTIPALAPASGIADVHITIDCPDPAPDETIDFNIYIDPSGNVRTVAGDPIADATVTLLRSDSPSGPFEQVPDGSEIMSPANRQNPDTTDASGHFGWDVIAGYYRVRAERAGCVSPDDPSREYVETEVLEIPPPVTDLDLRLDCPSADDAAPVTTATREPAANAAGWNRGDVRVRLSADDGGGSGVETLTYSATGAGPAEPVTVNGASAELDVTAAGITTVHFHARDAAGNAEEERTLVVRIDRTDPSVTIDAPIDGEIYAVGETVTAAYSCVDGGSGLAACAGPVAPGAPVPTATEGRHTFTVEAIDEAGNRVARSVSYRVVVPQNGRTKTSGKVKNREGADTHWSASVRCDRPGSPRDRFDLRWSGHAFTLSAVRRTLCFDDPTVEPTPASGFDTSVGVASGSVNGVAGYTLRWTMRDLGNGHGDPVHLRLTDPDGAVVLEVAGEHKTQAAGAPGVR